MPVVLGLRAKTGRAIAVVLSGKNGAPKFIARREISLVDPAIEDTGQPYHVVMEMPWSEAMVAVRPLVAAIERVAIDAVRALGREFDVRAVGIVGAPERQLEKIGNEHIRAHAAEGVLFRHVLQVAADANKLRHRAFAEKSLPGGFASQLKDLGRLAGAPWRADEKMAATAAMLMLR
jgi:hypothetical protein